MLGAGIIIVEARVQELHADNGLVWVWNKLYPELVWTAYGDVR